MEACPPCPKRAQSVPMGTVDVCVPRAHPFKGGHGHATTSSIFQRKEKDRPCPTSGTQRKRLFRPPSEPEQVDNVSLKKPTRTTLLHRVQVESVENKETHALVAFNCGTLSVVRKDGKMRHRLDMAQVEASMNNIQLGDFGSGWVVMDISPPSAEWKRNEVVEVQPKGSIRTNRL